MTAPHHPSPAGAPRLPSEGQIVLGLLLVTVGLAWLLAVLGVSEFRWDVVLAAALLLLGGGLVAGARTGPHAGMIGAGVALTLLLAVASSVGGLGDVPFTGGIGSRLEEPASLGDDPTYRLAVGTLEIDLTGTDLTAPGRRLTASVSIGRLVVRLPPGAPARVRASAAAGSLDVLGQEEAGLDVSLVVEEGDPAVVLHLSVGVGELAVER